MNTKKIEITLTATTALQYTEVVEVPVDISDAELNALVNERYTTVSADEFTPVPGDWERGDCGALDAQPDAEASVTAIRVPGGMLVQEVGGAEYGGLPAGEQQGKVVSREVDDDDGKRMVGTLEVPFRAAGDGTSLLPEKEVVAAACAHARKLIADANRDVDATVYPVKEKTGSFVIKVSTPFYSFDTTESACERLASLFHGLVDIETVFKTYEARQTAA